MQVVMFAIILSLTGVLLGLPSDSAAAAPAKRPDIVLFYFDDSAPYPDRLWNNPNRTPNIASFTRDGVEFSNALATTPLCGPSRANLLTGKYGHNSGMTGQNIGELRDVTQIQQRLKSVGYETAFIGKYINGFWNKYPTAGVVKRAAKGWDHFDVIWKTNVKVFGWRQWTRNGTRRYGHSERDHSSFVAAKAAARHIRKAPRKKPLFMVVSLIDGHSPYLPMQRFSDHPACRDIAPWQGPAYNEANVSDKPAYVRNSPRLNADSYDLTPRCEVAMTTDWVIGTVDRALKDRGRYQDTLQVLAADNGWAMGDHRQRGKGHAYTTPVPMYARWPARLGNRKRVVREPVAIVDLPRTFCAAAGCKMPKQDGRNLLPLIRGKQTKLNRRYIFTEMLRGAKGYGQDPAARPAWAGVDTTLKYDDTLWSYARYETGEEELYDISDDPHRLDNVADKPSATGVLKDVRKMWRKTWDAERVRFRTPFGS